MQEKDIKRRVKKQLQEKFPNWKRLSRTQKQKIAKEALEAIMAKHSPDAQIDAPLHELIGAAAVPDGIIPLNKMGEFIADVEKNMFCFSRYRNQKYMNDPELKAIDALLDDRVIDRLLGTDSYTPSMRKVHPHQYFRAELLKSLKYAEFSYRKFCGEVLNNLERKTERSFVGLPLHKKEKIDHSQLSQFRSGLSVAQLTNLSVYMIHMLIESGKISHPFMICGVDSTEVAARCTPYPLATITIDGKKVSIFSDIDADRGRRRKKRDKSEYFVGYRLHTLAAINPESGENYPLFSLVAPANHHDNLFLDQIMSLSCAMGLQMKLITADQGYCDADRNASIYTNFGVSVITPASGKASIPDNVDPETSAVFMSEYCETPMEYMGRMEGGHEFKCGAENYACVHSGRCEQFRYIPFDTGFFGQIPDQVDGVNKARDIRKNIERAYNLLKHREGLEPLRVRSQQGLMVASTIAHMATVLLEIVETRKSMKKKGAQQSKFEFAA